VTRSLSESECEEFEHQLLDSQEYREAVARAVELSMAAEFACRSSHASEVELPAPRTARPVAAPSRTVRRLVWSVLAASVPFFIGWQASLWYLGRDAVNVPGPEVAESERHQTNSAGIAGRELALAWEQTRRTFTLADDHDVTELATANGDVELSDDTSDGSGLANIEAPSWMLAAVAGMQESPSENASPEDGAIPSGNGAAPENNRDEG
jgi:hypothetical protein